MSSEPEESARWMARVGVEGEVDLHRPGCPPMEQLVGFKERRLPRGIDEQIAVHLKTCVLCRGEVSALADHARGGPAFVLSRFARYLPAVAALLLIAALLRAVWPGRPSLDETLKSGEIARLERDVAELLDAELWEEVLLEGGLDPALRKERAEAAAMLRAETSAIRLWSPRLNQESPPLALEWEGPAADQVEIELAGSNVARFDGKEALAESGDSGQRHWILPLPEDLVLDADEVYRWRVRTGSVSAEATFRILGGTRRGEIEAQRLAVRERFHDAPLTAEYVTLLLEDQWGLRERARARLLELGTRQPDLPGLQTLLAAIEVRLGVRAPR